MFDKLRTSSVLSFLFLCIFAFIAIFIRFHEFFQTPNTKVIEGYGDGYKTYMAFMYHVKHDSTYSHFQGMNYPYGDHVIPSDTQPLFSNVVKWLSEQGIDLSDYLFGILHFSMLFSIFLSCVFLFLIFKKLNLPAWYGIAVAIGVTFLSPQMHRMTAHFGLAHPFVIPLIIYLLFIFEEKKNWWISILIAFSLFVISQIHFYYFAILTFIISFYFLFSFLRKPDWRRLSTYALHYGLQIGLPLLFFWYWMYFDDPVTDRTSQPWGFFFYRAYPEGIFTSTYLPQYEWFSRNISKIKPVDYEGKVYVGMVAGAVFLIFIFKWLFSVFRKKAVPAEDTHSDFLNNLFLASFIILLFSFGLPFIIPKIGDRLLEISGPIRQFRSIGRFAWAFYFSANIIAFYHVFQLFRKWKNPIAKWSILIIPILILLGEATIFTYKKDLGMESVEELQKGKEFTTIEEVNFEDYQGILTVPYYNIGSDNFWWVPGGFIMQKSLTLSYQTGLPVTSAMLTRTSLSQTINQLQLLLEPYRSPRILQDLPNDKPLLILLNQKEFDKNIEKYGHVLEGSKLLYEKDRLKLYELPLTAFQEKINRQKKGMQERIQSNMLYPVGEFLADDSLANHFIYNSFDTIFSDKFYRGRGGLQGKAIDFTIAFDGKLPLHQAGEKYVFSIWMYMEGDLYARSKLNFIEYNTATGKAFQESSQDVRNYIKTFDNNGWALLELPVELKGEAISQVNFSFHNKSLRGEKIFIDELFIRPDSVNYYKETENYWWNNNRWWGK